MNKWRIKRLEINGFKIFKEFAEDYSSSLIVFDGPNGFGKTSVFDAKQLLFCGQLPRISARASLLKTGNRQFSNNLYLNHAHSGDISIIAELRRDDDTLFIMRKALSRDLQVKKNNKPSEFSIFKLYKLNHFDDQDAAELITDEVAFWADQFGENFSKNFSVLNYLQQDSKAIVIPDDCADKLSRTDQIAHLINLDELKVRQNNIEQLKKANAKSLKKTKAQHEQLVSKFRQLEQQLSTEAINVEYQKLTTSGSTPSWDLEKPITYETLSDLPVQRAQVSLLRTLVEQSEAVAKRYRNKQKLQFVQREEFALAVRLSPHFNKLDQLRAQGDQLSTLNKQLQACSIEAEKFEQSHLHILLPILGDKVEVLTGLLKTRDQLVTTQDQRGKTLSNLLLLRQKLMEKVGDESNCPLCGFDYIENQLLFDAVDERTKRINTELDNQGKLLAKCLNDINELLRITLKLLQAKLSTVQKGYNHSLLLELKKNHHQQNRLEKIAARLLQMEIALPSVYSDEAEAQDLQVNAVRNKVIESLEIEDDTLSEEAITLFGSCFNSPSELQNVSMEAVQTKSQYIQSCYNKLISQAFESNKKEQGDVNSKLEALNLLEGNLAKIEKCLNEAQNSYINETLGQMESLFHIYSGRLLQNFQRGLGVFIKMQVGTQKNAIMNFTTATGSEHDAVLSMSSGQISALSLALFLALNRKYAKTAFVFIDDPTQCMDEINIASLTDLLRVELRDRQVVVSTHEQDISDYLCYRYGKAGLSRKSINLQKKLQQTCVQH